MCLSRGCDGNHSKSLSYIDIVAIFLIVIIYSCFLFDRDLKFTLKELDKFADQNGYNANDIKVFCQIKKYEISDFLNCRGLQVQYKKFSEEG